MKKTKEKPLVLIVEDSAVEAEIIKRSVTRGGYEVAIARNGFDGLDSMMARKPAIVLSDINMPLMNGFEMCAAIREKKNLKDIPVILISALSDPEDVIMAITAGADGYITKPYDEGTLLSRIEALISAPRNRKDETNETMDIEYNGKLFTISINYRQQMNILLSVYENLISQNHQLTNVQVQLTLLNERLDEKVAERTASLTKEIEERAKTEEALRKSQGELSNAQQLAHLGNWEMDIQTGKGIWSDESYRIFGFTPGAFEPTLDRFMGFVHPDDRKIIEEHFPAILSGKVSRSEFDIRIIRPDGEERVVHDKMKVTTDESGKPVKIIGVNFDITERKRAEEALWESEQKFLRFFKMVPIPLAVVNTDGAITYFNDKCVEVFGYTRDDIPTVKEWWERAYPDESYRRWVMDTWGAAVDKAAKEGKAIEPLEYKLTCKNGEERIVLISGITIEDNLLATFFDITERKRAEEILHVTQTELKAQNDALRQTQEELETAKAKYLDLYNDAPIGYFTISGQGLILEANFTAANLLGMTRNHLIAQPFTKLIVPEDQDIHYLFKKQLVQKGQPHECELRMARQDGSRFWARLEFTATEDAKSGEPAWYALMSDITERKRIEIALQESEARHRAIMETANDAMICMDPNGKVYMWNRRAEEMFGYTEQEALGMHVHDFITHERYRKQARAGFAKFMETGEGPIINKTTEIAALRRDGSEFPIELSVASVKLKSGWCASAIVRDITERKKREQELVSINQKLQLAMDDINKKQKMLIRSEKLAALGQLSAGVGHELKNPLNIISTSTQLMMMEEGLPAEVMESGKTIMEQVMRAVKIIDNLREFARERKPERKGIGLCPFIEKTMGLVAYEMKGEGIEIARECPPEPVWIMGDEDQLAQVFLNITNNARDSMKTRRNSYSIEERTLIGWKPRLTVRTWVDDGKAKICFEDNGVGISEKNKLKLFTPFFTTKGESTGTGLGIAIAFGIIENHGGTIEFESEEGKGAAFTVTLPLAG